MIKNLIILFFLSLLNIVCHGQSKTKVKCEDLDKWLGPLINDFTEYSVYSQKGDKHVSRIVTNLYSDKYFVPVFGISFQEFPEGNIKKLYTLIDRKCPDQQFRDEMKKPLKSFLDGRANQGSYSYDWLKLNIKELGVTRGYYNSLTSLVSKEYTVEDIDSRSQQISRLKNNGEWLNPLEAQNIKIYLSEINRKKDRYEELEKIKMQLAYIQGIYNKALESKKYQIAYNDLKKLERDILEDNKTIYLDLVDGLVCLDKENIKQAAYEKFRGDPLFYYCDRCLATRENAPCYEEMKAFYDSMEQLKTNYINLKKDSEIEILEARISNKRKSEIQSKATADRYGYVYKNLEWWHNLYQKSKGYEVRAADFYNFSVLKLIFEGRFDEYYGYLDEAWELEKTIAERRNEELDWERPSEDRGGYLEKRFVKFVLGFYIYHSKSLPSDYRKRVHSHQKLTGNSIIGYTNTTYTGEVHIDPKYYYTYVEASDNWKVSNMSSDIMIDLFLTSFEGDSKAINQLGMNLMRFYEGKPSLQDEKIKVSGKSVLNDIIDYPKNYDDWEKYYCSCFEYYSIFSGEIELIHPPKCR